MRVLPRSRQDRNRQKIRKAVAEVVAAAQSWEAARGRLGDASQLLEAQLLLASAGEQFSVGRDFIRMASTLGAITPLERDEALAVVNMGAK